MGGGLGPEPGATDLLAELKTAIYKTYEDKKRKKVAAVSFGCVQYPRESTADPSEPSLDLAVQPKSGPHDETQALRKRRSEEGSGHWVPSVNSSFLRHTPSPAPASCIYYPTTRTMTIEANTKSSDLTLADADAAAASAKTATTAAPIEAVDHVAEPVSEDAIASESSESTTPSADPTPRDGADSSDSEAETVEATVSVTPDASEDEDQDDGDGDELDALTRGFASQATISHSTYLQTVNGDVIASGPGFAIPGHYVAKQSGRVYNTARPPPGECFNCKSTDHWRKDCPYGRRYKRG